MISQKFPEVEGDNLERRHFKLPYDLEGDLNLVIIPFKRIQQSLVDEWTYALHPIYAQYDFLYLYEIPTLSSGYRFVSFMIDGGMRAGIPDRETRNHTITLYINKTKFKKALNINTEDTIYIMLLDKTGEIIWRTEGAVTTEKVEDLTNILINYTKQMDVK
ncbi:MAG: hypothetical protein BAJALOKI3v1_570019 [Promethearchaeota archaeon]|nr:MAG: hypothetical protein BAJALOKI3v1_570019 [Candidatus Lokiarchaeota archaeon]